MCRNFFFISAARRNSFQSWYLWGKKNFNRPCDACENSNNDLKEPIVYLRKIKKGIFCVLSWIRSKNAMSLSGGLRSGWGRNLLSSQKKKKNAIWKTKKRWKEEHRKLYRAADVHGSWKKVKYTSLYWCQSAAYELYRESNVPFCKCFTQLSIQIYCTSWIKQGKAEWCTLAIPTTTCRKKEET